jgi:hypothetical protein
MAMCRLTGNNALSRFRLSWLCNVTPFLKFEVSLNLWISHYISIHKLHFVCRMILRILLEIHSWNGMYFILSSVCRGCMLNYCILLFYSSTIFMFRLTGSLLLLIMWLLSIIPFIISSFCKIGRFSCITVKNSVFLGLCVDRYGMTFSSVL